MWKTILFMLATILPPLSIGGPFACNRSVTGFKEEVRDYSALLEKNPVVRVLLVKDAKDAKVAVNGSYQITGSITNIVGQGQGLPGSKIAVVNGCITVGDKRYNSSELRITGARDGEIWVNDARYRGEIRILQQFDNKISVINELDLESFISSVLGSEMPRTWNDDALRAQAVTARTYAMYKKKVRRDDVYHLEMLELAYRGMAAESSRLSRIVRETKGVVMVYNWNLFPAYFHSTCGGHTEGANHVFGKDNIPPLNGVACGYCNNTKYSSWNTNISKSDIEKKLRAANVSVSNIHAVRTVEQGAGRHGAKVEIVSANGSREMNANEFRLLVGPNYLYSTAFDAKNNGKSISFSGRGWGHGVGLCQYGAQSMAGRGFEWTAILHHYYPKTELVRIY